MITKALLLRYESQTDEDTMDTFLEDLATDVSWEKATQAWFGIRYMRGEFGMYSVYDDDAGREAHLAGEAVKQVFAAEQKLMTAAPRATKIEILGCKMPNALEGVTKGLVLRFKAKPGKEAGTLAWFANRYDESHFGTFAAFADTGARFAHLTGQIPRALGITGLSLLGGTPEVHMVDVMAGTARQRG